MKRYLTRSGIRGQRVAWTSREAAPSGNQESEVRGQKNHFTAKNAKKRIERKKRSRHSAQSHRSLVSGL
ncbi:MAG: hypothetical protein FWC38_10325 [Proteobacteria bacterium]|nr:hypothetical protein [Pseudomonadota bacterium]